MLAELVKKSRSYRRFDAKKAITREELRALVDLGRLSPCGGNKQYLKYATVSEEDLRAKVYDCLAWAGYLPDWDGPCEEERPTGYVILLRDKSIQANLSVDEGIAAQSIFLGATELGYGGCMLMNVQREKLLNLLGLDKERYAVSMVIALGVVKEEVVIEAMPEDGDVKYWRDKEQVHHVPKRSLAEVLVLEQ
ncbi:MAG: nitroreductase family protein [bacterium]|nr:nitroreductase family protein [bacterium]